jgi:NOL1/NOP2/fmu family ribosome biogenesis protein
VWCGENLTGPLPVEPTLVGTRLYAVPADMPDLAGLRVLHPGWWLGTVRKDRFGPVHALAMGLDVGRVGRVVTLSADDAEALKYLRCETLSSPGDDGWVMVAVQATPSPHHYSSAPLPHALLFPLGWGKRVQGIIKNHYPRGLLWG